MWLSCFAILLALFRRMILFFGWKLWVQKWVDIDINTSSFNFSHFDFAINTVNLRNRNTSNRIMCLCMAFYLIIEHSLFNYIKYRVQMFDYRATFKPEKVVESKKSYLFVSLLTKISKIHFIISSSFRSILLKSI